MVMFILRFGIILKIIIRYNLVGNKRYSLTNFNTHALIMMQSFHYVIKTIMWHLTLMVKKLPLVISNWFVEWITLLYKFYKPLLKHTTMIFYNGIYISHQHVISAILKWRYNASPPEYITKHQENAIVILVPT